MNNMDSSGNYRSPDDEKSTTNGETAADGVWQTTQLDSAIGDLQRGTASIVEATKDGKDGGEEAAENGEQRKVKTRVTRKKRRVKPRIIPPVRVYVGTFVHSTVEEPMQILENWMLGVDGGKIIFSQTASEYNNMIEQYKLKEFEKECIIKIPDGSFMMPGFIDCHTQVASYLLAGLRSEYATLDKLVENHLKERRTKTLNVLANDKSAGSLFTTYVTLSLMNGITCAAYNGSVVESAARLLVDTIVRFKQRAVVGLEMFYGDNRDDTHMFQIIKACDVAQHIVRKKCERVKPCLILSKPLPDWLEKKVCDMAEDMDLPIKLSLGDQPSEELKEKVKGWVEIGESSVLRYHKKHGLINSKTMFVHCSLCTTRDVKMIAGIGARVVHCPSADLQNFSFYTLSNLLKRQIPVGLGSDLNSSHSVSMLETMRVAMQCVNLGRRWPRPAPASHTIDGSGHVDVNHQRHRISENDGGNFIQRVEKKDGDETDSDGEEEKSEDSLATDTQISYKDLFRLATLGGATVLGLDQTIGNFEVGKDFDALFIQPNLIRSKFVVVNGYDTMEDVVEKFIFLGDDRNIAQVYVAGERIV